MAFEAIPTYIRTRSKPPINPADYGLIADGNSHPLSGFYGSLAAAQTDYPFVTALAQEIDYCACKMASNLAFGGDLQIQTAYTVVSQASDDTHIYDASQNWTVNEHAGKTAFRKFTSNGFVTSVTIASNTATVLTLVAPMPSGAIGATNEYALGYGEHGSEGVHLNRSIELPAGSYRFGNDTWLIRNLAGGKITGTGRRNTIIRGNKTLLAFDGVWYTHVAHLSLECQATDAVAALELDGNVPGHPYATRGVQGVTLQDLLIDGGGSTYALAMTRQGGSSGQGSECGFINCHLQNASFACYYQNGFNALANTFFGGNFQNYPKHGAYIVGGTFGFINTGFQSTHGYKQLENDGYDISCGSAGAYEGCIVYGCRTESLRFLKNVGAVRVDVRACVGNLAMSSWFATTTYGAAAALYKAIMGGGRLFVATTEGTTGTSQPDWAAVATGGTVVDGTVIWTETPFNSIDNQLGSVDLESVAMRGGGSMAIRPKHNLITTAVDYTALREDILIVDCTAGPRTVTLTAPASIGRGHVVTVKKSDTSANAVTISLPASGFEDGAGSITIPGGSRGSRTLTYADGTGGVRRWHLIGSSSDTNIIKTTSLAFGTTSPVSLLSTGVGDVIDTVEVIIDTPFNGTPTLSVGISGTVAKYLATADVDLTAAARTVVKVHPGFPAQGTEALIATYVAGGASVGAARLKIHYGREV
jgi:hypothetical protein